MRNQRKQGILTWVHDPLGEFFQQDAGDCKWYRPCLCYKDDGSKLVCTGLRLPPMPGCIGYGKG